MSTTLVRVQELARGGELRISAHGYEWTRPSTLSGVALLVQILRVFL